MLQSHEGIHVHTVKPRLALIPSRFISTTVDEVYQAMRNNPGLPNKDEFVQKLNTKLQARLSVQLSQTKKRESKGLR